MENWDLITASAFFSMSGCPQRTSRVLVPDVSQDDLDRMMEAIDDELGRKHNKESRLDWIIGEVDHRNQNPEITQ